MAGVTFTESADNDVDEIVAYLAGRGGPPSVQKYLQLFDQAYVRLRQFPRSGHPRPKLGPQVRIVIVPPYLIIYDWDAGTA
jgi:toxin ParE1/3/4